MKAKKGCRSLTTYKISALLSPAFYDLHRQIREDHIDEIVAKGGRGSTKSSAISLELILMLLKHPECHAVVLRKVANTLRASVYAQICWAISALGLGKYFRATVSPMEITYLPTGQKIMFFGMDDPGKLKSIKVPFGYIGMLWFEELDQFSGPEEVRNVEQSCLRGGPFSFTFKSFNPPAMARNWANRYALEERDGKLIHHSTYLTTPPEWLGPRFLTDAERLKVKSRTSYRHEYLGEVVGSGSAVFENLKLEPIPDAMVDSFDRRVNGVDWGYYPDPWAFNGVQYDAARRTLYIFDEATAYRASNLETAEIIRDHGVNGSDLIIADSAEPKSVGDYKAYGLMCRGAKKGPGSVEYSHKWLQSLDCIWIDPARCPDTAKEFSEYEYERDKNGAVMPGYPDADNHHIDAVRYATESIWKRKGV